MQYWTTNLTGSAFAEITKQDIKTYTEHLKQLKNKAGETLSVKTINRKLVTLNQFIAFLNNSFDIKITVPVKQLKIETQNIRDDMLDVNDVKRIVRAAEREDNIRAKTICYTLFYTGARVSEMLQIKTSDIDKDTITVKGKGSKYRDLFIPKKLKEQWKAYAKVRLETTDFLFSGERGPINRQTVHNEIKEYTGKARGISKELAHAHSFRHIYAQCLDSLGFSMVLVSQLLGHSGNVTGSYMQQSKKELLKMINKLDIDTDIKKKGAQK
jgi:integrase/recombinase XerD